ELIVNLGIEMELACHSINKAPRLPTYKCWTWTPKRMPNKMEAIPEESRIEGTRSVREKGVPVEIVGPFERLRRAVEDYEEGRRIRASSTIAWKGHWPKRTTSPPDRQPPCLVHGQYPGSVRVVSLSRFMATMIRL